MIRLRYGNTNTFYLPGQAGGLLVDTDYAGTLPAFYRAIKQNGVKVRDIACVLATHYHPDHAGLIGELMKQGVRLLLIDVQKNFVHFPDAIFARDGIPYLPADENAATVISCGESRKFLARLGIRGEILSTPSHSPDSVCLVLDDGDCLAGDLEPFQYLSAYGEGTQLKEDWDRILSFGPKRILYAHRPETVLE